MKRLKIGEAPEPDDIRTDTVKMIVEAIPDETIKVYNNIFKE